MPTEPADLQFEKVETRTTNEGDTNEPVGLSCANCRKPISTRYYQIAERPLCEPCKVLVAQELVARHARGSSPLAFSRAALFGLGAAAAGGALYLAVIVFTGLEIGLIAIASGYLVGRAVRAGAWGMGSVAHQALAAALTYLSVVFAYAPMTLQAPAQSAAVQAGGAGLLLSLLMAPAATVVDNMPSGLIGGLIIGFGVYQAWRMTGDDAAKITGPFEIGAPAPASAV